MRWTDHQVTHRHQWAKGLVSLFFDWSPAFEPGQFATVTHPEGVTARRAYSIASAPGDPLELLIREVPGGSLSPWLTARKRGGLVRFGPKITGRFTLSRVPPANTGWLLCTGTGLAPFLSMLRSGAAWSVFEEVVLAVGVRDRHERVHRQELAEMEANHPLKVVWCLSRDDLRGAIWGRITEAFASGKLEDRAGATLTSAGQVMLCGRPDMIEEVCGLLADRGLSVTERGAPGQVTVERYW